MKAVTYKISTGEIDGVITANMEETLFAQANEAADIAVVLLDFMPDDLFDRYFVNEGVIKEKQHFTIDNIPLPATATIEGDRYELTEQPTFEFSEPGQYEVTIDAGPAYYVETFTVDYPPSS